MTIRKLIFAIFGAATTVFAAQDGPAVAGLEEWIKSFLDRQTRA
jgi:hypothetical protein